MKLGHVSEKSSCESSRVCGCVRIWGREREREGMYLHTTHDANNISPDRNYSGPVQWNEKSFGVYRTFMWPIRTRKPRQNMLFAWNPTRQTQVSQDALGPALFPGGQLWWGLDPCLPVRCFPALNDTTGEGRWSFCLPVNLQILQFTSKVVNSRAAKQNWRTSLYLYHRLWGSIEMNEKQTHGTFYTREVDTSQSSRERSRCRQNVPCRTKKQNCANGKLGV